MPLAYFLTWTTYGTWLRGDPRGSSSEDARWNAPVSTGHHLRLEANRRQLKHDPIRLSPKERQSVTRSLEELCAHRGWIVLALNTRTNHVHLVLKASGSSEKVMTDCKAWSTRRLRELDPMKFSDRVWTRRGSKRQLFDDDSIRKAVDYVRRFQ
ncbi:MAG: transposase [Phycisphaerales bacterium JB040]